MSAIPMQYPNLEQYYMDVKEIANASYILNEGLDRKNKVCTIKEKHTGGMSDDKKSETNMYT
ncbi:hypothetical protein [Listeria cornellensis]|uniref:Uncharacterized protein n=1 Tax=Listeria cornellensis FSL F6-0969 TaxID=1265820 RepID=W7BZA2_9LIST|nr:hypothetical protein [Listeria cornellensis]EUJ25623.1 hypothetical protein PCORN_16420 [Listeria cornellensis FSL F6-0969]